MFRLKITTLNAIAAFIFCWIVFTMMLLEIFDQEAVDRLFEAKRQATTDDSEPDDRGLSPAPSADAVASVVAKYAQNAQRWTLFLGDLKPEDREILELVFYAHLQSLTTYSYTFFHKPLFVFISARMCFAVSCF